MKLSTYELRLATEACRLLAEQWRGRGRKTARFGDLSRQCSMIARHVQELEDRFAKELQASEAERIEVEALEVSIDE